MEGDLKLAFLISWPEQSGCSQGMQVGVGNWDKAISGGNGVCSCRMVDLCDPV